jgi:hypothetical protein
MGIKRKPVVVIPWLSPHSANFVNPKPGEVYRFINNVSTRAGHIHPAGSLLYVRESTTRTPHGEIGPRGLNWICRTQFDVSVWATLEHCIECDLLVKVEPQ